MRVSAFIEPCLPSPADRPPSGADWVYEIKLDGFRMMARRNPAGVRLLTRKGYDWTGRFPLIAEAAAQCRDQRLLAGLQLAPAAERNADAPPIVHNRTIATLANSEKDRKTQH